MSLKRKLQIVSWQDRRDKVAQVNPELFQIIDQINPPEDLKLIEASFNFGDLILKDGVLQLPSDNKLVSVSDNRLTPKIKDELLYSTVPLFMILDKISEVFINTDTRIIPLNIFNPGSLLGLFESVDSILENTSEPIWSVSAGARSIFMLPKIYENTGIKRLKLRFDLPYEYTLNNISDHFNIFTAIAKHSSFEQPWQNTILFFTKDWLTQDNTNPNWIQFYNYIFKNAWQQAKFAISKIQLSLNWETFINAISARNFKPTPYLSDQVKHILAIASGKWPAFRPAEINDDIAPIKGLQEAFIETYLLKKYIPTIMHTHLPNIGDRIPVYYSLYYPTLLEGSPHKKISSSIMLDIRDIKFILETLKGRHLSHNKFKLEAISQATFDFFHVENDIYHEIKSSSEIPKDDPAFLQCSDKYNNREFCASSPFWRGCIRIIT